jgi:tetratricopeptide (TPR) repeat protein
MAYSKKSEYDKSIELEKKAVDIDRFYYKGYARLVSLYMKQNNLEMALFYCEFLKKNKKQEYLYIINKLEKEV